MELREGYTTVHAAQTALQHCMQHSPAARPGDMLVWDRGTTSHDHSRPAEWPALLISFKIRAFNTQTPDAGDKQYAEVVSMGRCMILAFVLTANGRLRYFNARFVRLPKGMKSVSDVPS